MQRINNIDSIEPGSIEQSVLTIGNFDGVHRGHRALLGCTAELASEHQATACALTFWPHPQAVVGRGAPTLISTLEQRQAWIEKTGIQTLIVQEFDGSFSQTSPTNFLELLKRHLNVVHLVLGKDFHFGKGGDGDIGLARARSDELGFAVTEFDQVYLSESVVSSSHVREVLEIGDVRKAHEYLGRPWQIWGAKTAGAGRGRTLGFPTINFATDNEICVPDGVYGGRIRLADGAVHTAAISVGTNPTFGREPRHIEAYILDCDDPTVEGQLSLEFLEFVRAQVTYSDAAKLIEQIEADVAIIRDQAARGNWLSD